MLIYFDLEIKANNKIASIGATTDSNNNFVSTDETELAQFINKYGGSFFIGHNVIKHDINYFRSDKIKRVINNKTAIDTLYLSTLLYPKKPYHSLVKNDKLNVDQLNNPVNDSINTRKLFYNIMNDFDSLDSGLKEIYYLLLNDVPGFEAFFKFKKYKTRTLSISDKIRNTFKYKICSSANLRTYIKQYPIELAYALALIATNDVESILPAWVLKQHSYVETILENIRNISCDKCAYCNDHLDSVKALNTYFGYPKFREFNGHSLQKDAVEAALKGESLVAVFPTGGGKSLTFQLPAIISGNATRGLTVVISPLQSLMKDQVDTLENKSINKAVSISGLLDPIERTKAIKRVAEGEVNILYIAPESLRSKTIERLIMSRQITRFVIDEAHCFSTWGHDFRVDYLYIGNFIKKIQEAKELTKPIPVSCFTATAKVNVINDIKKYFYDTLQLEMKTYTTDSGRTNLNYYVYKVQDENDRYDQLRRLLSEDNEPTIIYSTRIKTVEEIYKKLKYDQFDVTFFHGRLEKDEKVYHQDLFMQGKVNIMVATSAFGMGIDKDNVKKVIHYEISDSIENYIQEAGRAGRNQEIQAKCYILYNEDDLNKHFELLNATKLNIDEIKQMWRGIKHETSKGRDQISNSPLELAKSAGWHDKDGAIETKVKTAIATLEDAGFIVRLNNSPRIFADSIISKSVIDAYKVIDNSYILMDDEKRLAKDIMRSLISSKYKSRAGNEIAEMRIDYLADLLYVDKHQVIQVVNKLREISILADDKDLYTQIEQNANVTFAKNKLELFIKSINFILNLIDEDNTLINIKQLKSQMEQQDIQVDTRVLRRVLNYLDVSKFIKLKNESIDNLLVKFSKPKEIIIIEIHRLRTLCLEILEYLYAKVKKPNELDEKGLLPFSIVELLNYYNQSKGMVGESFNHNDIENAIYLITRAQILKIEGGFLVIYNPLNIKRLDIDSKTQYKKENYEKLDNFYTTKKEQIHIVGDFAERMSTSSVEALKFVSDYFNMEYSEFLNKYFPGKRRKDLERNMTPEKFNELFGSLSDEQTKIVLDQKDKRISVSAGPGSGKTKLLVHKLASIIMTEDIKHEHLLMLTFSRQAAIEFKQRLYNLIGPSAYFVHISTFHSYAFDLLEKLGNNEDFDNVITEATNAIKDSLADPFKITKSVLVIDEAQDMTENEFEFITELIKFNDGIRVIAVGDDDQNIYEFRGSDSKYLHDLSKQGTLYELTKNFRSVHNLVEFSNGFIERLKNRLKTKRIQSYTNENGNIDTYKYDSDNLIIPVVNQVIKDKYQGTTCIITKTNEDAIQITSLLKRQGIMATLIQTRDDFRLMDMYEIRSFFSKVKELTQHKVSLDIIIQAVDFIKETMQHSNNLPFVIDALKKILPAKSFFDESEMFISDLNDLLFETFYSDIYNSNQITVSTFHKAKGKEFDNVYLMYPQSYISKDEEIRLFYVGLTRAKINLSIHSNMDFNNIKVSDMNIFLDKNEYQDPDHLEIYLNHKDIALGSCKTYANNIKLLYSGMDISLVDYRFTFQNKYLAFMSNAAKKQHQDRLDKGYEIVSVQVNHLVYWYDKLDGKDHLIVLPKILYKKTIVRDIVI